MKEYTFVVKRARGRIELEPVVRQTSAFDVLEKLVTDFSVAVDADFDVIVTLYWSWLGADDQAPTSAETGEVAELIRAYVKADDYIEVGHDAAGLVVNRITGPRHKAPYGLAGAVSTAQSMLNLKPELTHVDIYHRSEASYPVRTIRRDDLDES